MPQFSPRDTEPRPKLVPRASARRSKITRTRGLAGLAGLAGFTLACGHSPGTVSSAPDAGVVIIVNFPDASPEDCGAATNGDAGLDPECAANLPLVSFTRDVAPLFGGCGGGELCHSSWTYDTVVKVHSYACCDQGWLVLPGEPSRSAIVQALCGTGCVGQMPPGGPLPNQDIDLITAWVCEGALRN